jgi:hypothetical protein
MDPTRSISVTWTKPNTTNQLRMPLFLQNNLFGASKRHASQSATVGCGTTFPPSTFNAMADTGQVLNILPQTICNYLHESVTGASETSGWQIYFQSDSPLPAFWLGVGSKRVLIASYIFIWDNMSNNMCIGSWQCGTGSGGAVFGMLAFEAFLVVHYFVNMQIGFF